MSKDPICCNGDCHHGRRCPRYEQEPDWGVEAATALFVLVIVMVIAAFAVTW
jgi:hypothetical protein